MATQVTVSELPPCDFCREQGITSPAHYDGKTALGPWAYMCNAHYTVYGIGLGTGKGQRLIVKDED